MNEGAQSTRWGQVDGQDVFLYTIQSPGGLLLQVTNYGASVQSLHVPVAGGFTDVVLGYDTLQGYCDDAYYMGAVVGRSANRIKGGRASIDGQVIQLPENGAGFHHHGGAVGFNKKVWHVVSLTPSAITLRYVSAHLEEGYPGELEVLVTYRVEGLTWKVDFEAKTDRPTLVNLTQHAYFNLKGIGDVLDHVVQLDAPEVLAIDERVIPTGEFFAVHGTPLDFAAPRAAGARIDHQHPYLLYAAGYDHFYVLEHHYTGALKRVGAVYVPGGVRMEVFSTAPGVHFYTGNFIDEGTPGKGGVLYGRRSGLCLETHHFPDTPNHSNFPTTVLRPGETYTSHTSFRFTEV